MRPRINTNRCNVRSNRAGVVVVREGATICFTVRKIVRQRAVVVFETPDNKAIARLIEVDARKRAVVGGEMRKATRAALSSPRRSCLQTCM